MCVCGIAYVRVERGRAGSMDHVDDVVVEHVHVYDTIWNHLGMSVPPRLSRICRSRA